MIACHLAQHRVHHARRGLALLAQPARQGYGGIDHAMRGAVQIQHLDHGQAQDVGHLRAGLAADMTCDRRVGA